MDRSILTVTAEGGREPLTAFIDASDDDDTILNVTADGGRGHCGGHIAEWQRTTYYVQD